MGFSDFLPKPAPTKTVPTKKATFSNADVTSFLLGVHTSTGWSMERVEMELLDKKEAWFATPENRQRLDHYVGWNYRPGEDDDPEGWDEEGWWTEYAGPLKREVQVKLDARFGKGNFSVSIGEKGHIHVYRVDPRT